MQSETTSFSPTQNLRYDFPAAIVVFLVALPLCLGVALASGVPLFSGIIAGAVGGIIIGAISRSPLSVSGPAAGLTVLVLAAVQRFPAFETFLLTVFLAGVIQVALGLLRAGIIGDFIPNSVIKGMLAAIGLILILKQIPHALGYDKDYEGDFSFQQIDGQNTFSELWNMLNAQFTLGAIFISVLSLGFLFWWDVRQKRLPGFLKLVPGPLVVVIFGVAANLIFQQAFPAFALDPEHLVSIPVPSTMSEFLGQFRTLSFAEIANPLVWQTAATLGIVASLETLLSIEAIDRLDPFKRVSPTNRELLAQGVGNMTAGLIGGMPVTSVIVRSSANVGAGARTQASTIIHGLLLIGCAAFIPRLLNFIPLSALAAVLIATGYKLTKPALFFAEYRKGWSHFIPFVVTVVAILFTDLLTGIVIGLIIGSLFVIYGNYRSTVSDKVENGQHVVRIKKDLSFIHKYELKRVLSGIPNDSKVLIDLSKVELVDLDNMDIINDFIQNAQYRNVEVNIKVNPDQKINKYINLSETHLKLTEKS